MTNIYSIEDNDSEGVIFVALDTGIVVAKSTIIHPPIINQNIVVQGSISSTPCSCQIVL